MLQRVLEPEVMDSPEEAAEYDAMDFLTVNRAFAQDAIALYPFPTAQVLDLGTGTARIPLLIAPERPHWQILGIDLAASMLTIGRQNVQEAGLNSQIQLELMDAKQTPYKDESFDVILSNSLVHHLPDPLPFFREIKRLLKPQGALLVRDLLRPRSLAEIQQMVSTLGPEYSPHQAKLFADSLHAAFTLSEIQALLIEAGLDNLQVYQSSDRHWTASQGASVQE